MNLRPIPAIIMLIAFFKKIFSFQGMDNLAGSSSSASGGASSRPAAANGAAATVASVKKAYLDVLENSVLEKNVF